MIYFKGCQLKTEIYNTKLASKWYPFRSPYISDVLWIRAKMTALCLRLNVLVEAVKRASVHVIGVFSTIFIFFRDSYCDRVVNFHVRKLLLCIILAVLFSSKSVIGGHSRIKVLLVILPSTFRQLKGHVISRYFVSDSKKRRLPRISRKLNRVKSCTINI